jgi:hypothetical protein
VAIYKGEFNFLEAADYGVQNFNYMRFGIVSKDNIQIRRLNNLVAESEIYILRAAQAVEKYRELDYWTPGAVSSAFKSLRRLAAAAGFLLPDREKGFFCSYLVAQSYLDAGIELCEGLKPWEVHPGDLMLSPRLCDVSDKVVADLGDWDKRTESFDAGGRARELSRLAVAPTLRRTPPLPGHTLTAPSTTARLVRSG